MGRLTGKVALVTGGALGIGAATVKLFAAEGAQVVLADINKAAAEKIVDEVRAAGGAATFVALDVSHEDDWRRAMSETLRLYGKLNVLVNNAGISLGHDIEETTLDEWEHLMGINATGVFLGMKHGIAAMKQNGEQCSIINRSSIDGQIGEAGLFAYCASKGAVTIMTKSAALATGAKGYTIRVNSVHPGYVHTPLTEKEASDFGLAPDEYFEKVGAQHPIGFIGEPIDIAYLDLYLASDESRWVTGAEFTIDGGWTAQ
jgi:NAD(P)-dependent dehydrogenase (short-subunit alcohol dehydrogenase family)